MPNQAQSLAMFRHDNCTDVVERASGRLQLRRKSSTIHKFRKKKPRFSTVHSASHGAQLLTCALQRAI